MSKQLKDFISENRADFDSEDPSPASWQRIENVVIGKKTGAGFFPLMLRWAAAAAVVCFLSGTIYFMYQRNKPHSISEIENPAVTQPRTEGADLGNIAPEFAAEAKKIYQAIKIQQQQLRSIAAKEPELYSQFSLDLATLDSSYRVLKTQAVQAPGREMIIRAMLQNLQLQAELLGKQLMIIQKLNNRKNNDDEKNNNRSL
jgi:hypothetical protein